MHYGRAQMKFYLICQTFIPIWLKFGAKHVLSNAPSYSVFNENRLNEDHTLI